jgi:hypothetical protein
VPVAMDAGELTRHPRTRPLLALRLFGPGVPCARIAGGSLRGASYREMGDRARRRDAVRPLDQPGRVRSFILPPSQLVKERLGRGRCAIGPACIQHGREEGWADRRRTLLARSSVLNAIHVGRRRSRTLKNPSFERSKQLGFVGYKTSGRDGYRAGLLVGGTVVDAAACAAGSLDTSDVNWRSVTSIVAGGSRDQLRAPDAATRNAGSTDAIRRSELTLVPPSRDPHKILCIRLNYREDVEAAQRERPELGTQPEPVVFSNVTAVLIGDGDALLPPDAPPMIDWDGVLAAVIGRQVIFNDVSARDIQMEEPAMDDGEVGRYDRTMPPRVRQADVL